MQAYKAAFDVTACSVSGDLYNGRRVKLMCKKFDIYTVSRVSGVDRIGGDAFRHDCNYDEFWEKMRAVSDPVDEYRRRMRAADVIRLLFARLLEHEDLRSILSIDLHSALQIAVSNDDRYDILHVIAHEVILLGCIMQWLGDTKSWAWHDREGFFCK